MYGGRLVTIPQTVREQLTFSMLLDGKWVDLVPTDIAEQPFRFPEVPKYHVLLAVKED